MQIKTLPVTVKAGPDAGLAEGEFIVYPSTFTRTPDSYGDIVKAGAFVDTIKEWQDSGNTLPGLFGHRMDDPDYFVASATEMSEDEHGWRIKGMFDMESPKGPQVYRLVKSRRLNQLSFAFETLESGPVVLEGEVKANELRKLKVYEFSFVPIGANQDTSVVAVKAVADYLATKAGRTISAKNEDELRAAHDALGRVLSTLDSGDGKAATGTAQTKDEGAVGVKSEESAPSPAASLDELDLEFAFAQ